MRIAATNIRFGGKADLYGALIELEHLRQLRTFRTARIVHIAGSLLCTVGGDLI